jgi:hypothetical protein
MAQEFNWLARIGTLDDGVALVNHLGWNLQIGQVDSGWVVQSGESVIYRGESRADLDAFLYGMALACSVIPSAMTEMLREEFSVDTTDIAVEIAK